MDNRNENSGVLFKNDRKEKDSHPDYTGTINVDGIEYWISSWIKESKKDSRKFLSLAVKPKNEAKVEKVQRTESLEGDDIPF